MVAGGGGVGVDLRGQRGQRVKALFIAQLGQKAHRDQLAVQVAGKIKQMEDSVK